MKHATDPGFALPSPQSQIMTTSNIQMESALGRFGRELPKKVYNLLHSIAREWIGIDSGLIDRFRRIHFPNEHHMSGITRGPEVIAEIKIDFKFCHNENSRRNIILAHLFIFEAAVGETKEICQVGKGFSLFIRPPHLAKSKYGRGWMTTWARGLSYPMTINVEIVSISHLKSQSGVTRERTKWGDRLPYLRKEEIEWRFKRWSDNFFEMAE